MAVVRISKELIDQVKQNAHKSFDGMKIKAREQLPTSIMDGIYDRSFGPYETQMKALPSWFFYSVTSLDIEILEMLNGEYVSVLGSQAVAFSSPKLLPAYDKMQGIPCKLKRNGHYGAGMRYLINEDDPWDVDLLVMVKTRNERINRVSEMSTNLASGFEAVLSKFTTLAPALKVCPELWDFLPEDVRNRHMLVKEKKPNGPADLSDVDSSRITSLAALTKMVK